MFNSNIIQRIWEMAEKVEGYNPNIWRKDFAGAWIRRDAYGTTMAFGWEIDHLRPVSLGGSDELTNLNAIHWRNNRKKADDYPNFFTSLSSSGNRNIEKLQSWRVG